MLDAAREARQFVAGRTRDELATDTMLLRATVKAIEIVGEAASKVTANTRKALAEVPWIDIVGMRHRLIHTYFEIDLDIVWATVQVDLPPLIDSLQCWVDAHPADR